MTETFAFAAIGCDHDHIYGQTEASVFITQQPDGEVRLVDLAELVAQDAAEV